MFTKTVLLAVLVNGIVIVQPTLARADSQDVTLFVQVEKYTHVADGALPYCGYEHLEDDAKIEILAGTYIDPPSTLISKDIYPCYPNERQYYDILTDDYWCTTGESAYGDAYALWLYDKSAGAADIPPEDPSAVPVNWRTMQHFKLFLHKWQDEGPNQ
jgi:hypothetical protein